MVAVLTESAIVPRDSWERHVSKRCAPTAARVMGVAMASLVVVSVMLGMGVQIALSQCVQIVKMVSVAMRLLASVRSAGKVQLAAKSLVKLIVKQMVGSAAMVNACAQLALLAFNARPRLMPAQTTAIRTAFATTRAISAIAPMVSPGLIAPLRPVRTVAMNPTASVTTVHASVPPIMRGPIAKMRIARTLVATTANAMLITEYATATLVSLGMIAVCEHVLI